MAELFERVHHRTHENEEIALEINTALRTIDAGLKRYNVDAGDEEWHNNMLSDLGRLWSTFYGEGRWGR